MIRKLRCSVVVAVVISDRATGRCTPGIIATTVIVVSARRRVVIVSPGGVRVPILIITVAVVCIVVVIVIAPTPCVRLLVLRFIAPRRGRGTVVIIVGFRLGWGTLLENHIEVAEVVCCPAH